MQPNPSVTEEVRSHQRFQAFKGWELPIFCEIDKAFWLEQPCRYSYRFSPIQMRLTTPNLVLDTHTFLAELATRLNTVLSVTQTSDIDRAYSDYIDKVKNIKVVREVLLVETDDVSTLWTIIESPPFDDTIREPIYNAQLHILRSIKGNTSIDFYVLNLLELPENEEKSSFIPAHAKLIWKRE